MAEGQEDRSSEDLGDEISQHRLEEFRGKGQVSQSKELTAMAALLAASAVTYALAPSIGAQIAEFMREVFRADFTVQNEAKRPDAMIAVLIKSLKLMVSIGLPISLAGFALGVVGSFAQIGSIFSFEPLTPKFDKINPLAGLQRMFSLQMLVEALRLIFKTSIALAIAYGLIKTQVLAAAGYVLQDPMQLFGTYANVARATFWPMFGTLAVFAGVDWWVNRRQYEKQLKLTKQEAKQEHKEREGDPHVKARIRSVQREMARKRMMQAVRKADVIITNPTHIAIAIVYEKDSMAAPKVVAKGADLLAQKIKAVAAEAGVPLVENVPLARTLYKTVKIGQAVPRSLYQAVAEVLAYVYRLRNRGF